MILSKAGIRRQCLIFCVGFAGWMIGSKQQFIQQHLVKINYSPTAFLDKSTKHVVQNYQPMSNVSDSTSVVNNNQATANVVFQTRGEMGAHLRQLGAALEIEEWIEKEYHVIPKIWIVHVLDQQPDLSRRVFGTLQKCFPKLAGSFGFIPSSEQIEWAQNLTEIVFTPRIKGSPLRKPQGQRPSKAVVEAQRSNSANDNDNAKVMFPTQFYLSVQSNPHRLPSPSKLRDIYAFDANQCCPAELPSADDTVLHIRGFNTEVGDAYKKRGLYELDPDRTASELLGHLEPGSSIWILGRFPETTRPYQKALEARGHVVKVIFSKVDVHDFCILSKANRIAGTLRSGFFSWSMKVRATNWERADVYQMHASGNPKKKHPFRQFANQTNVVGRLFDVIE